MNRLKYVTFTCGLLVILVMTGCRHAMVISKVDYSQPIETVLVPNDNGMINDVQHGLQFSVMPLQYAETQDTSSMSIKQIRLIRGHEGFYYITSDGFKNVYVMAPEKNELKLKKKIEVAPDGIKEPALNQRKNYVQLVSKSTGKSLFLSADGIVNKENSKQAMEATNHENNK